MFLVAAVLSIPTQAQEIYSIDIRLIRVVDQVGHVQNSVIRSLLEDAVAVADEVAIHRIRLSEESPFTNTKPFSFVEEYSVDGEPLVRGTRDLGSSGTVRVSPAHDQRVEVSLKFIFAERGVPQIQKRNAAQVVVQQFHTLTYDTLSFETGIGTWHFHKSPGRGDNDLNVIAFRITESGEGGSVE
jgi:hypothetical protein